MNSDTAKQDPIDKLGMTDGQWEWFQNSMHGYGEQDAYGIDISLLRENLRLTPTERLDRLQSAIDFIYGREDNPSASKVS